MMPQFLEERKMVKKSAYGPPGVGFFAADSEFSLSWEKCREQFAHKFTEVLHGFYFCHIPHEGFNVASFIAKTEEIIGFADFLHSYGPSKFCETDKADVIWIEPSRFWSSHDMRRQLLTIMLRAGMNYNPSINNYEEALWEKDKMGNNYAAKTKAAITRFLFGFTNYVNDSSVVGFNYKTGWVTTFEDRPEQAVRKLLVRPEGEKKTCSVIGLGKLWT